MYGITPELHERGAMQTVCAVRTWRSPSRRAGRTGTPAQPAWRPIKVELWLHAGFDGEGADDGL